MTTGGGSLPLEGVRVVELVGLAPGPLCGMMLADFGADVVRVDRPTEETPGLLCRNKRTVRLDLKRAGDLEAMRALLRRCDVLLDTFRPGVLERLGLGPEELLSEAVNPRLVVARLTGYGQSGPLSSWPGHDINYAAVAGGLSMVGPRDQPPALPSNLLADFAGGSAVCFGGVLLALLERHRTGRGKVVDASMADGVAYLSSFVHAGRATGLWSGPRGTNLLDGGAPFYRCYEASDGGYLAVGALEPRFYREFLRVLLAHDASPSRTAEEESLPGQLDREQWPLLEGHFARILRTRTRDDWALIFSRPPDSCVTPVLEYDELASHPFPAPRTLVGPVDRLPVPAPRLSDPGQQPVPRTDHAPEHSVDLTALLREWSLPPVQSRL